MKISLFFKTLIAFTSLLVSSVSFADVDVETDQNSVILAGHDAVSYFTESKAVEGYAGISAVHNGAIYHFSSTANRDTFNANPEKYAPQFGGFCAYGATLSKKFDIDGKAFEVVDGKLYVNKNLDVYEVWEEEKIENIVAGNKQWPNIQNVAADKL